MQYEKQERCEDCMFVSRKLTAPDGKRVYPFCQMYGIVTPQKACADFHRVERQAQQK